MYFTTMHRSMYIILHLVLHLFTFICSPINICFSLILDFIKLCTHDFSRVNFAAELSTNLVYKSIFVIDYNYIFIYLLFFFTVKLSVFSRLCVKHKRVISRSTYTEIYKLYTDLKKTVLVSDRYRQILRTVGIGSVSVLKKWYRVSPSYNNEQYVNIKEC